MVDHCGLLKGKRDQPADRQTNKRIGSLCVLSSSPPFKLFVRHFVVNLWFSNGRIPSHAIYVVSILFPILFHSVFVLLICYPSFLLYPVVYVSLFSELRCAFPSLCSSTLPLYPLPSNCQSSRLTLLSEARGKTAPKFYGWSFSEQLNAFFSRIDFCDLLPFHRNSVCWGRLITLWSLTFPMSLSIYGNNLIKRYNALFWELKYCNFYVPRPEIVWT